MGAKAAVGILHKKKLGRRPEHEREAPHDQLAAEHERIAGNHSALITGVVDEKIGPGAYLAASSPRRAQAPGTARPLQEHPAVALTASAQTQNRTREVRAVRFCVCSCQLSSAVAGPGSRMLGRCLPTR